MTANTRDLITGLILLALSVAWCGIVLRTIPRGAGGGDVGPRAFPLWLGVFLGIMALIMVARAWIARALNRPPFDPQPRDFATKTSAADKRMELLMIGLTFGILILYGATLPLIGFNLSTALVVVLTLVLCLRLRSVFVITGMTVGIPLGCWLIFGKLLHIPLATGGWINLG